MPTRRLGKGQTVIARVYLLANYNQRRDLLSIAEELESLGYFIASSWIYDLEPQVDQGAVALRNLMEIAQADVMLVVGPTRGFKVAYELGYARACGLRVVMANVKHPHLYDSLPNESYGTVEELMMAFRRIGMFRFKRRAKVIEQEAMEFKQ